MTDFFSKLNELKVIILDDHLLLTEGLIELLKRIIPTAEINAYAQVDLAKAALKISTYDFLLCDVMVPGDNIEEFVVYCRKNYPDLIIIMLTSVIDTDTVRKFFSYNVNGYMSKGTNFSEFKMALEKTYKGQTYISSDLSGRLVSSMFFEKESGLTPKELGLLRLIAAGHNTDKMAAILHISPHTVSAHRRSIMNKLGIHTSAGLVKYAFEHKII
jgi:DNA-binding NarL/FixJ family response regulator